MFTKYPSSKSCSNCILSTLLAFCTYVVAIQATALGDPLDSLTGIAQALANSPYNKLTNIKASGDVKQYGFDPQTKQWSHDLNSLVFTEIVDATGSGKFRLDLGPTTTPWEGGDSKYFSTYESITYNGKFSIEAKYKQGEPGNIYEYNQAVITATPNKLVELYKSWLIDGCSTGLLKVYDLKSITAMLSNPKIVMHEHFEKIFTPSVHLNALDGKQMVSIEFKDDPQKPGYVETLWLDPARGFLLIRRVREFGVISQGKSQRHWEYNVKDAKEVSKGVWLPTKSQLIIYNEDVPELCANLNIESIDVNVPETDDTYNAAIKIGSYVEDQRFGVHFQSGDSPGGVAGKIQNIDSLKK